LRFASGVREPTLERCAFATRRSCSDLRAMLHVRPMLSCRAPLAVLGAVLVAACGSLVGIPERELAATDGDADVSAKADASEGGADGPHASDGAPDGTDLADVASEGETSAPASPDAGATEAGADSDGDGTLDAADCAPHDAARWRIVPALYVDADGDGFTVGGPADRCVGSSLAGYAQAAHPEDCDDTDASRFTTVTAYRDEDTDGVGEGAALQMCVGGALPSGYALMDGDCAPIDPTRWQLMPYAYRDADGDGYTVPAAGAVCAGASLPRGYTNTAHGDDCNDADPTVFDAQTQACTSP
jgi:hypothetical protein